MKWAKRLCLALLLIAMAGISYSQSDTPSSDTSAKSDMKDAGKSTKRTAKKTGSAVKKTAKKGTRCRQGHRQGGS
jgi:uncharacterized protein (UPF0333 family)